MEKKVSDSDYAKMVYQAINAGNIGDYTTKDMMVVYCKSNAEELNEEEEQNIVDTVNMVFKVLEDKHFIKENASRFVKVKDMDCINAKKLFNFEVTPNEDSEEIEK